VALWVGGTLPREKLEQRSLSRQGRQIARHHGSSITWKGGTFLQKDPGGGSVGRGISRSIIGGGEVRVGGTWRKRPPR